jgi:hypothetical protein
MSALWATILHGFIVGLAVIPAFTFSFQVINRSTGSSRRNSADFWSSLVAVLTACLIMSVVILGPAYLFNLWNDSKLERRAFGIAGMVGAGSYRIFQMFRCKTE